MKPLLLILISAMLFSCGKVHYLTFSSHEALKNDQRELVIENDTLKIVYRFSTYPGLVKLTIFNKSSMPIQVNWRKSAIIMDDQPTAYYSSAVKVKGDVKIDTVRSFFRRSGYSATIDGQLLPEEAIQFLPPYTQVSREFEVSLPRKRIKHLSFDTSATHLVKSPVKLDFLYKKVSFDQESSPFQFRSFITLDMGSGETFLDHHFYISEVWQCKSRDNYLPSNLQKSGDLCQL